MHHVGSLRRLTLGAAIVGAALIAVPAAANAASTCSFDTVKKQVTVIQDSPDPTLTLTAGAALQYRDGSGPAFSCFSPSGVQATPTNTDLVQVKASVNPAAYQHIVVDERNGIFGPGATPEPNEDRIYLQLLTGSGGDRLTVLGGSGSDWMNLHTGSGLSIGAKIDMDYDGDDDLSMTIPAVVRVDGGLAGDLINASGATSYAVELFGGKNNDYLYGGPNEDYIDGGSGNDQLLSKGDGRHDTVDGGSDGDDTATVDYGLDTTSHIDHLNY
jgi:hypothetical protein